MTERYLLEPSLNGPRNKLIRARVHLKELCKAFEWTQKDPAVRPQLKTNVIDEDGWRVVRVKLNKPPPKDMSIIAGDAIHNMRTALDHLACQLVVLNKKKPDKKTSFPIYDTRPTDEDRLKGFEDKIKRMSKPHRESVKALQPFELKGTKEGLMMSRLGGLDNMDKHRMIPPALPSVVLNEAPSNYINTNVPVEFESLKGQEFDDDLEASVARFRPEHPATPLAQIRHEINFQTATSIALGEPDVDLAMLDAIHDFVSGIIESFGPEFP